MQLSMYYQSLYLQITKGYVRLKMECKDYILAQKTAIDALRFDPKDSELNMYAILAMGFQGNLSMAQTYYTAAKPYAASRDPRRGETPVMCASTVQVAAPPGEVVSNTGKQNRKVLAAPVMESFASITGVTTLLRQKHGNCPPPPIFLHSIPFSFVRRSNYRLPLIPSSDGSHACAAEMVRYREERNYEP